jgi:protein TonB
MKTEHVESMDELVFKNKNKLYGAYFLRRRYQKYLLISLLFGFFVIFSAISYPLIAAYLNPNHGTHIGTVEGVYGPMPPPSAEPPPPPPPPPPAPVLPDRIRFVAPVVVDKDVESEIIPQGELAGQTSNTPPPDLGEIPPVDNSRIVIEPPAAPPEPFLLVEEMPQFPGGDEALLKFLSQNLHYPAEAKETNITGTVYIYFVVEPDGSISSLKVKRGIGAGCDEEALRVVRLMPVWSPGKQRGMPVRVQFTLPVKFTLH